MFKGYAIEENDRDTVEILTGYKETNGTETEKIGRAHV